MIGDVLEKASQWPDLADDPPDVWPQVPGVALSEHPAGAGEPLAGVSASDEIHLAAPRLAVEGSNIRPDRCRIQGFFFHAAHKDRGRIGFPLDITHASGCRIGEFDAKFKSAGPRAEGQDTHFSGRYSHAITTSFSPGGANRQVSRNGQAARVGGAVRSGDR